MFILHVLPPGLHKVRQQHRQAEDRRRQPPLRPKRRRFIQDQVPVDHRITKVQERRVQPTVARIRTLQVTRQVRQIPARQVRQAGQVRQAVRQVRQADQARQVARRVHQVTARQAVRVQVRQVLLPAAQAGHPVHPVVVHVRAEEVAEGKILSLTK